MGNLIIVKDSRIWRVDLQEGTEEIVQIPQNIVEERVYYDLRDGEFTEDGKINHQLRNTIRHSYLHVIKI